MSRPTSVPAGRPELAGDETRCAGPGCDQPIPAGTNRYGGRAGRPALYCDDLCRKAAYRARRRAEAVEAERQARIEQENAWRTHVREMAERLVVLTRQPAAGAVITDWATRQELWRRSDRTEALFTLVRFLERDAAGR